MAEVSRIGHRRVRPGCDKAYEELARAMLEASSHFPGCLSAMLIPPGSEGDTFQIIQRFASQGDLERWRGSEECAMWHERLSPLVESDPEYRLLEGLEMWFAPKSVGPAPQRWRMAFVTWMGIYPLVAFSLWYISPRLKGLPYLLRVALLTALVVGMMAYVVMPRLSRWMAGWIVGSRRTLDT